jgi:hypothetical protein
VALTLRDPGVTWDEPDYLASARLEVTWLSQVPQRALDGSLSSWVSADTLERYWHSRPYFNPHPPFYKVLGGLTWLAFRHELGAFPAFRLATAALFGILVGVVCLWGARAASLPAGIASALALALMPRVFGDAHVAATDMPLTVCWSVGAWLFWGVARHGRRADVLAFGAAWGAALAVKFTGMLLAVPLALWGLAYARRQLPRALLLGGSVALALRVLLDPYLWPDPLGRLTSFIEQSTTRAAWAPISTFYLGRSYGFVLPWHQSVVMTLVTTPLPFLVLAAAGALRFRERHARPLVSLCLIQIAFYQTLMALPSSPNHDGVRLFLPQFPFLALLGGLGFEQAWDMVGKRAAPSRAGARPGGGQGPAQDEEHPSLPAPRARRRALVARRALCAAVFVPPAVMLAHAHPFELAYYNEVVGGARGALARGFEATYWWDAATPRFLTALQRVLPPHTRVWVGAAPYHFQQLQEEGLLRRDLVFTDSLPAPFLILQTRQGLFRSFEWRLLEDVRPLIVQSYDGVPLLALYRWE